VRRSTDRVRPTNSRAPAPERAGVDVSAACRTIDKSHRPYSSPGRRAWSVTCPTEPKGRDLGGRPRRIESRGEEHGCDDDGGDADRIRGNDRDITSLDPLELRRRAALVLQTAVLFERTVRDNLLRQPSTARPDLSEARLVHALTDVGLDADLLDRDSATLSGGEKQV